MIRIDASAFYLMLRAHDHIWAMHDLDLYERIKAGRILLDRYATVGDATYSAVLINNKRFIECGNGEPRT